MEGLSRGGEWSDERLCGALISAQAPKVSPQSPPLHSGNPFPEKQEGQGRALWGCCLWLLTSLTLTGARAVPGLNRAVGTLDLVHGQLSVYTELSSIFPAGPRGTGLGGFCPHPYACGVSMAWPG